MGWKNQVIYQLKGYVQAPYGGGALFFEQKELSHYIEWHLPCSNQFDLKGSIFMSKIQKQIRNIYTIRKRKKSE